jgi:DNA-binding CsgD family transcriptional regulator
VLPRVGSQRDAKAAAVSGRRLGRGRRPFRLPTPGDDGAHGLARGIRPRQWPEAAAYARHDTPAREGDTLACDPGERCVGWHHDDGGQVETPYQVMSTIPEVFPTGSGEWCPPFIDHRDSVSFSNRCCQNLEAWRRLNGADRGISEREWLRYAHQLSDGFGGWSLNICAAGFDSLTARERKVMGLVVSGLLNKQIAADLGASDITIQRHRAQVMQKMGAESLCEMVRMAETLGIPSTKYLPEYTNVS